jgi:hypothetical protein
METQTSPFLINNKIFGTKLLSNENKKEKEYHKLERNPKIDESLNENDISSESNIVKSKKIYDLFDLNSENKIKKSSKLNKILNNLYLLKQ